MSPDEPTSEVIFRREGARFLPTDRAVSPWGGELIHGGPAAALLARAAESEVHDADFQVSRLTVDLLRPVPRAPFEVSAETVRAGNRLKVVEASLLAGGALVAKATALALRRSEVPTPPGGWAAPLPAPEDGSERWQALMPGETTQRPGFHLAIDARRVAVDGRTAMWVRIPMPVVDGEVTTPLMRAAATSDFVNAFSTFRPSAERGGPPHGRGGVPSINADMTLYLHRLPEGEWLAMETERVFEPHGLGVSWAVMHDRLGPVGRVMQATLANSRR